MLSGTERLSQGATSVLLFSGGLDSTALAVLYRPALLLFVDYGQRPAELERTSSRRVADCLGLEHREVHLGISEFGSGLLAREHEGDHQIALAPSPEWWPYRNQFLATAGAAVALQRGLSNVLLGSVAPDGLRHRDGTAEFYQYLDALIRYQEGGIRVHAPAMNDTTEALLRMAGLGEDILGWTASCHRSNKPCGQCPGCWKRSRVLSILGIAGYDTDIGLGR